MNGIERPAFGEAFWRPFLARAATFATRLSDRTDGFMEGDVIATINRYHKYISHYHTGGVPGRNEIDDTQELNYPAIMKAIVATGFKGYVAQEFIPKREDKIASLAQGVQICDVG